MDEVVPVLGDVRGYCRRGAVPALDTEPVSKFLTSHRISDITVVGMEKPREVPQNRGALVNLSIAGTKEVAPEILPDMTPRLVVRCNGERRIKKPRVFGHCGAINRQATSLFLSPDLVKVTDHSLSDLCMNWIRYESLPSWLIPYLM